MNIDLVGLVVRPGALTPFMRIAGGGFMNTHVDARVREVFQQLPFLIGFSLDRDLCVCDIEVDTLPGARGATEPTARSVECSPT
jgi:hypothetical protein